MAGEPNGGGRLDRIEANLETTTQRLNQLTEKFHLMVDHHDAEFKQLMIWQVLTQDEVRKTSESVDKLVAAQKTQNDAADKRVGDLVGAIRDLIDRIPSDNLRKPA